MTRPLLPPRGVYVSTRMIYHPQLPPAVILTWIQLRGLAWDGTVTPPLNMQELADLTAKCQATIYSHLVVLRQMRALSWRSAGNGRIVVSFTKAPSKKRKAGHSPPQGQYSQILDSKILESQNPSSSPLNNTHPLIISVDKEELIDSALKENNQEYDYRIEELKREEGDSKFQESGIDSGNLESANPVDIYREIVHLTPNAAQKRILQTRVTNLPVWQQTLEHWITHGWNPLNIAGILDLYGRGGVSGCRYCPQPRKSSQPAKPSQPASHAALEELRTELGIPSGHGQP
jgi:hypothetical protein